MNVFEFAHLCTECAFLEMTLYDLDSGKNIYIGSGASIPPKFSHLEVQSYDKPHKDGKLIVNVSIEGE